MALLAHLLEHNRYLNLLGIVLVLSIAWLFSHHRRRLPLRLIVTALAMQFAVAFLSLKTVCGQRVLQAIACGVSRMYQFADVGATFVFGNLANPAGSWGFIFAIKVLPIIIFFGAFMALLFHLGIVQRCVAVLAVLFRPLLGTSGAETLCAISNSFLGQTEAPLLVRNYLKGMTKSEILVVMVSGMATISGAILAVFSAMGVAAEHMLTASVMAIPASLMIAKILYPETERSQTAQGVDMVCESSSRNAIDAISSGTSDGLQLALNVGAMLVSFLALLALLNALLGGLGQALNALFAWAHLAVTVPELSLNFIFGRLFYPFAYLLGMHGSEAIKAAELLGTKVAVNELIAFGDMVRAVANGVMSERSAAIMTYALCGFSNFSCIGIQIGGIGALVPEKRAWLSELGLYAVLGGALSNLLSAMVVALLL